jgi:chromosome segregation ATPase
MFLKPGLAAGGAGVMVRGITLALLLVSMAAGSGQASRHQAPLSRVLITQTDLRAALAKLRLARYYLDQVLDGASADEDRRPKALGKARRSLEAADFYLASSREIARGELRRDLDERRRELRRLEALLDAQPERAIQALEGLRERLRAMLGHIEPASRTYKGSPAWSYPWSSPDGPP